MTISLLLPLSLAALAACLIPLLIHLARRSEQRLVMFAALRWLQAKPQPRRNYRFEEILLLLLRLLLLVALALLLAEPVLFGRPDRTPWIVVAPGVDVAAARRDIGMADAHWHRLAPGLPLLDEQDTDSTEKPATNPSSLSSLLREVDATIPAGTALTVLVPPVIVGADAERPVLSRNVDWRVVPGSGTATPARPVPPATPSLMVRHSPERTAALRYLRAAGEAWMALDRGTDPETDPPATTPVPPVTIALAAQPIDVDQRYLVWLVPGPLPDSVREWIIAGGSALLDAGTTAPDLADAPVLWRDADGPIVRGTSLGRGRVMRLERELVPAAMPSLLEPDFPIRLRRLLVGEPPQPTLVDATVHTPRSGRADYPEEPRPLAPWLAMLVALVFLMERWVAGGPRRKPVA
ncbi:BatA domain-containing protein [Lysobacter sp. A378]